jgi:predicted Rossmann fold flavoprotein
VSSHFDIIIIGAGAAGLMCAIEAGKRGRKVLVIEHNDRVGRKIAISGGGRCNFTNLETPAKSYLSENPHFAKSALSRYTPNDFIKLIEKHVIDMLISECKEANVEIKTSTLVLKVSKDDTFSLLTTSGVMTCDSLVIATGGLSIPNIGATNFGYRIAEQFGLKVNELRPALVPLLWNDEDRNIFGEISGVSIDAKVTVGKVSFRENLLFTHRGVSGPVILQISSYWKDGDSIFIDLLPDTDTTDFFEEHRQAKQELTTVLSLLLPKRFVQVWCEKYFPSKPMNQMSTKALTELESKLHGWEIRPVATEGFEKAEVTAGGVDTNELSSKTMEARNVAGLYFIGEVVDVTGWLGGYNFQWAWSSGWAAGQVC